MTTIDARREAFNMGRVVSQTFGAIGRNGQTLVVLALGLVGVPQIIIGLLQSRITPTLTGAAGVSATSVGGVLFYSLLLILVALIGAVMAVLLQATVIKVVIDDLNGQRARLADALSGGLSAALPVIAIGLLAGLGIGLGLGLLIVPGLMLAARWIVAVPARVTEGPGIFAALARSSQLTKGYRWPVFGLLFVFAILVWIVEAAVLGSVMAVVISSGGNALTASSTLPYILPSALLSAAINILASAGVGAIYCELRLIKEGAAPTGLAGVFD
jgi:uncharacterized membrane protein